MVFLKQEGTWEPQEGLWKPRLLSLIPEILRPVGPRFYTSYKLQGCCRSLNSTWSNRLPQEKSKLLSIIFRVLLILTRPSSPSFSPKTSLYLKLQPKELPPFSYIHVVLPGPHSAKPFLSLCQTLLSSRWGANRCLAGLSLSCLHTLEISILTCNCLFALPNFHCCLAL